MDAVHLKTAFRQASKIEPFYTGGHVLLTPDEKNFLCTCGDEVKVVEVASGKITESFKGVCRMILHYDGGGGGFFVDIM
jgi:hypothetical protein